MTQYVAIAYATLSTLMLLVMTGCGESPKDKTESAASTASTSPPVTSLPANAEPATDPCTLLTDEEIQGATGYAVSEKKSFPAAGQSGAGCDWTLNTDARFAGLHRISMTLHRPGGRERFKFMSSSSLQKIPDVGDGAIKSGGNTDGTFWAVTGDTMVTLRYAMPVTVADPDPLVVPLLKTIVSRQ